MKSLPTGKLIALWASQGTSPVPQLGPYRRKEAVVDFWTNPRHTEPLVAALMAGESLVVGGNGDVYSVDEGRGWLEQSGWRYVEHKSLGRYAGGG